jgi:hypothetical protein
VGLNHGQEALLLFRGTAGGRLDLKRSEYSYLAAYHLGRDRDSVKTN